MRFFNNTLYPILVITSSLFFVVLIWLPTGMSLVGVIEEWDFLSLFTKNGPFFYTGPGSPMAFLALRPLTAAPMTLAYLVSPESFVGWNVINTATLIIKAISATYLIWWSTRDRWLAIAGGALFMVYPADTMQMTLRAIHINFAIAASVAGIALVMGSLESRVSLARWSLALAGGTFFVLGALIYETGLLLAPAPALLMWVRYGFAGSMYLLRTRSVLIFIWISFIVVYIAYLAFVYMSEAGLYQQTISSGAGTEGIGRLRLLFTVGLYRQLLHGWFDAILIIVTTSPLHTWFAAVLLTIMLASFMFLRFGYGEIPAGRATIRQPLVRLVFAGLILAALGYLPYLASASHILITQRTQLYASLGGAIVFSGLIGLISMRSRFAGVGLCSLALALGMAAQWNQVAHYNELSKRARMLLAGILEKVPLPPADGRIFVIDRSGQLESTWMLRGGMLENALTYLYGKPVQVFACVEPGLTWSSFVVDAQGNRGKCVEHNTEWEIGAGAPGAFRLQKSGLTSITIEPDGSTTRRTNETNHNPSTKQIRRWSSILGCWPSLDCRYAPARARSWRFDFGSWWSLEQAPWGGGWRDAEWNPPSWRPKSCSWMISNPARLWVPIEPMNSAYKIRMRVCYWASQDAKNELSVKLNGVSVSMQWEDNFVASGEFDGGLLTADLNELLIYSPLHPTLGISVLVDWVEILPN